MKIPKITLNWKWLALTLAFWIIALEGIPRDFYDLGGDSAQYIILAESLAQGKGFRVLNYPQKPFSSYYPPVFALLLAPIICFWGRNFYLMRILTALLGYVSLFFIYHLFKKYADKKIAFTLICFFALNWVFILYSTRYILSDVPYLCFSSLALFWASRYAEKPSLFNREGLWLLAGLALTYLTRYIGLTLFPGIIIFFLSVKKDALRVKRAIFIAGGFLLIVAAWSGLTYLYPTPGPSHGGQLFLINPYAPDKGSILINPLYYLPLRFTEGVNYYSALLTDVFFIFLPKKYAFLKDFLGGLIIVSLLWGLWRKSRENKNCVFHYYFLFYFFLIIFWPFREGVRFLLPVLPFLFFYFLNGLREVTGFILKRFYQPDLYFLMCALFIFSIFNSMEIIKSFPGSRNDIRPPLKNFISLHGWIADNLPKGGLIISRKPAITYFYTNHQSICYPFTPHPDKIQQEFLTRNAKYLIVDEFSEETYRYLSPFIHTYKNNLKLLHRIADTGLFEIIPDFADNGNFGTIK